jgi:hypothetical protein
VVVDEVTVYEMLQQRCKPQNSMNIVLDTVNGGELGKKFSKLTLLKFEVTMKRK